MKPFPLALLLAAPAAAQAEWPQYHGSATHDNARKGKLKIDHPEVAWHVADAFGQPTVWGDEVYSGGKSLFRLNAETGEVLARADLPSENGEQDVYYGAAPILTETSVIARLGTGVEARTRDLNEVLWTWEPPRGARGWGHPATLAGDTVLFTLGSDVIALDAASGELEWQLSLGGSVDMVPAVAEGRAFVGTSGGLFVAIDVEAGEIAWEHAGSAEFGHTHPVVVDGLVVVGDRGVRGERRGAVNAFDAETGEKKWETVFGATGFSTPGVHDGAVLAGFGRTVGFFDLDDGEVRSKPRISCGANAFGSPTVIGKHLVYGNLDGNLYVHDVKNGRLQWQFRVPDAQVSDFVHAHDRLYVGTTAGLVALVDGKGRMKGNVKTWSPPGD